LHPNFERTLRPLDLKITSNTQYALGGILVHGKTANIMSLWLEISNVLKYKMKNVFFLGDDGVIYLSEKQISGIVKCAISNTENGIKGKV
jgi:hypothetical protein